MRKSILTIMAIGALLCGLANQASAAIAWGFENWTDGADADNQIDGWGTYNLDFQPNSSLSEPTGRGRIGTGDTFGITYYGAGQSDLTGLSSSEVTSQYHFLYFETFDIQGDLKISVSGASGVDRYFATPHLVSSSGPTGDPTGQVLYNPGQYVFDLAGWAPSTDHPITYVEIWSEGAQTTGGFDVRRVYISDTDPLSQVPEVSSWLLLSVGLIGVAGMVRTRLNK